MKVQFSKRPLGLDQSIAPPEYSLAEQLMNIEFVTVILLVFELGDHASTPQIAIAPPPEPVSLPPDMDCEFSK